MIDLQPPPHAGLYGVVYADPPWTFTTYSDKGKDRSAEMHYTCMSLHDIKSLPVKTWAAPAATLYLWCTAPHLENAFAIMNGWGFTYRSNFVWIKDKIGTGYWARNRHEHLLIGGRGDNICPRYKNIIVVDSVIQGQQRQHSRKPDLARKIIESYHPNMLRLELFARESKPGWDGWGNEVGLFDQGNVVTRRHQTPTRPINYPSLGLCQSKMRRTKWPA